MCYTICYQLIRRENLYMKKRISKVLVMIIMFSLITSLIPMNQTNVSCAATYLGKFNAE